MEASIINISFQYTPKSGSKLVARKITNQVRLVQFSNSSYFIYGGVPISYMASIQGRWFRSDLIGLCTKLVYYYGGFVFDDQGRITYHCPAHSANIVNRLIMATFSDKCSMEDYNGNIGKILAYTPALVDNCINSDLTKVDFHYDYNDDFKRNNYERLCALIPIYKDFTILEDTFEQFVNYYGPDKYKDFASVS
ncbi:MAG: hypothetical protein HC877_18895 [Thioploca sp.]|nr:hypothetical protein [Thioploca sp.]